jgi:hypothetical protein
MLMRCTFALVACWLSSIDAQGATHKEIVEEFRGKDIDPAEVVLAMERTGCFGTCPAYRVTITGTGHVEYEGRHFVVNRGVRESTVSPEAAIDIASALMHAHFFDASSEYFTSDDFRLYGGRLRLESTIVTDGPSTSLKLKLGKHEKHVHLYDGYPAELREVIELIDKTVDIEQWIGTYCERDRMPAARSVRQQPDPKCEIPPVPLRPTE